MSKDRLNEEQLEEQLSQREEGLYKEEETPVESPPETQPKREIKNTFDPDSSGLIRGWTRITKELIPSQGLFDDSQVEYHGRPARTSDIREFTPIAEDPSYRVEEKINFILSECLRLENPNKRASYKDILNIDKIFFMLAIRDMTFYNIPNPLINNTKCTNPSCGEPLSIEVYSNNSSFFEMSNTLRKFYDKNGRVFLLDFDDTEIKLSPPTIGRKEAISKYIEYKTSKGFKVDKNTLDLLNYINLDWRELDNQTIDEQINKTQGWSINEYSAVVEIIREIKKSVVMKSHATCGTCGAEVTAPFTFQGGFRDFFLVQNILG